MWGKIITFIGRNWKVILTIFVPVAGRFIFIVYKDYETAKAKKYEKKLQASQKKYEKNVRSNGKKKAKIILEKVEDIINTVELTNDEKKELKNILYRHAKWVY